MLIRFVSAEPQWELLSLLFKSSSLFYLFFLLLFFFVFCLFFVVVVVAISWAAPAAYGGSQARG